MQVVSHVHHSGTMHAQPPLLSVTRHAKLACRMFDWHVASSMFDLFSITCSVACLTCFLLLAPYRMVPMWLSAYRHGSLTISCAVAHSPYRVPSCNILLYYAAAGTVAGGYGFRADEVPILQEHLRSAEFRQQQEMMQQQQQLQVCSGPSPSLALSPALSRALFLLLFLALFLALVSLLLCLCLSRTLSRSIVLSLAHAPTLALSPLPPRLPCTLSM